MNDTTVALAPNDVSLLFLLAADPTEDHFNELRESFEEDVARDVGRMLVGGHPEEVPSSLHDVLRNVANEFTKRTRAARAQRAAVAATA